MTIRDKGKKGGSEQTSVGGGGAATSKGILFQQQVGAVIGTWLLADRPLDHRLDLGEAKPKWLRFETEAPVDDILVGTSADGFVAFQVKTNVSLSKDLGSAFGKTVSQFVRHWLECRDGDGKLNWDRPLDAQVDRLVLAVGPETSASVRMVLPAALRLTSQPGGGQLNAKQRRAFDHFETCVQAAWKKSTVEPYSPDVVRELAALVNILDFETEGSAQESATEILPGVAETPDDAPVILTGIEAVCAELMAQRGGVDRPTLRRRLLGRGFRLLAPKDLLQDINRLKDHSNKTAMALERFEQIEGADGEPVSIVRDCQDAVRNAALGGSLLVIGEPGAGKSGVLNTLARDLRKEGSDVLELAVDEHSVETLEGLGNSLGLDHDLLKALEAWDGTEPAWLILDGLDASRGGRGGEVFRTLIEQVMSRGGRWRVIASIRTFDLRMGQRFQETFKGEPPFKDLSEGEFSTVRHVRVPPWTPKEFAQLLAKVPDLQSVMENAPQALKNIAAVPFNTRLLSELVKDGPVITDLSHVASQAELLQLYWKRRIEFYGAAAQACIQRVVKCMVEARVLHVPFETAAEKDAAVLDVLESAGVLISDGYRRRIQFRHHILFDFAASRVLLDPEEMIRGKQKFSKSEARGLMLAPALMFVLREIWVREAGRAAFWTAAAHVLADREGDPVIRSAAGRICAELPERHCDMSGLAERIVAGEEKASQAFPHVCGALGVRLDDCPELPLEPWIRLVRDIAPSVASVQGPLRFLLFRLVGRVNEQDSRRDLGTAARALLDHSFSLDEPGTLVASAIDLVGDTYSSNVPRSRELLERVFAPNRLDLHAAKEVPALCRKIGRITAVDPEFAVRIYRETYDFDLKDARETNMSDSQILPLRSNARQDYGMARYALEQHIGAFLKSHPEHAIEAIVKAVESHVKSDHSRNPDMLDVELQVDGQPVRLREDWSHIWAHDPETNYSSDAIALVVKLLEHLRSASEAAAIRAAKRLTEISSLAIFWSRLFIAACERGDKLLDFCLPIAMKQEFLALPDTMKDAVDAVSKGYERLSLPEREAFEAAVSRFNFSRFSQPADVRMHVERRLFGEIGEANVVTDHAREIAQASSKVEDSTNQRLAEFRMTRHSLEPYHWIKRLERDAPANRKLMAAIDRAERALGLEAEDHDGTAADIEGSLQALEALVSEIDRERQNSSLIIHAEGHVSKCIDRLVDENRVPDLDDDATTARFLDLFRVAAASDGPELFDDTEADFEEHGSWGSPAPRVDAAKTALNLAVQRPDLHSIWEPMIDELLQDPHPAVRLEAVLNLGRIWNLDQTGFWRLLESRLADEKNSRVIDHVCREVLGQALHMDAERAEQLIFRLLNRFELEPERQARTRKSLADLIGILWVTYERQASYSVLESWISDAAMNVAELSEVLTTLRMAYVAGLSGPVEPKDADLRHRAQVIANKVVAAAGTGLESHLQIEKRSEKDDEICRNYALLLDAACLQMYFAAKAVRNGRDADVTLGGDELEVFFGEVGDTLKLIGNCAMPRTIHYLLQLCEFLVPVNPAGAFDLAMHAVRSGGQRSDYQFEPMGTDLLVRLVGLFLADHDELFEEEVRRNALVECLEIFMEAGWPAAQRLLYRLPELFH